jgi:hypothetical protein
MRISEGLVSVYRKFKQLKVPDNLHPVVNRLQELFYAD